MSWTSDNYAADWKRARRFVAGAHWLRVSVRLNRVHGARALDHLICDLGIDQAVDLGCGLPHDEHRNWTEAMRHIVYVDSDPDIEVHRYLTDGPSVGRDGLPGGEGAFLLCSFWLVDALAHTDRLAEAEELFEQFLSLRSDLGLLAEEYDQVAGRQLGNFPQAYSLLGLVNTAVLLHNRRKATAKPVMAA